MRRPFTQLYVHLVWATWDRLPLITDLVERLVYPAIRAECTGLGVEVLELGGIEDHMHLLARIPTTVSIAELAKQVKGASSHLVTHRSGSEQPFKWQGGYGAFAVSRSVVPQVGRYIQRQREHHEANRLDLDLETIWTEED
jgi:REP element-mobilizing transposase RayT